MDRFILQDFQPPVCPVFWEGSPPNFTHISFILAPGKAKTFSIQLWINIHMLFFFFPFSIICLFSQLHWVSLCQQLWGFALAGGGEREGSILSQGEEVSRGSMVQTVVCVRVCVCVKYLVVIMISAERNIFTIV